MQANFGNKVIRASSIIAIMIILLALLKYVLVYIYPFIIILIIAFLLHPLVSFIEEKWKWPRSIATFLVMCSFFGVLILSSYMLFSRLLKEVLSLFHHFPVQIRQLESLSIAILKQIEQHILKFMPILESWQIEKDISVWIDKLTELSMEILSTFLQTSTEIVNSLSYIGFVLFFIVVAVYMVTKDFIIFMNISKRLLSKRIIDFSKNVFRHMSDAFAGLVKAQITLTLLSTILICFGLFIFRTNHLFIITLIIFIVDFIPYLGIGLIFVPWIFYSFLMADFTSTIQLSVLYTIIIVFRQIMEPKLIGSKIGIHPFIALSILFLGIQLFGVIGFFITPICLIFISALYRANVFTLLWDFIQGEN